jgi:hypothetical protein
LLPALPPPLLLLLVLRHFRRRLDLWGSVRLGLRFSSSRVL